MSKFRALVASALVAASLVGGAALTSSAASGPGVVEAKSDWCC